jgi:L-rhamnose mutarotase
MRRFGMVIGVRPEKLDEYKALHAEPWSGVLDALRAHNVSNYSIFLSGDLLFGYYEYLGDDYEADMAAIAADPVTQQWWQLTDACQRRLPGTGEDQWWTEMEQVFLME